MTITLKFHLYEISIWSNSTDTESRIEFTNVWGDGLWNRELLFSKIVCIWDNKKELEMDSGNGHSRLQMYLTPMKYIP